VPPATRPEVQSKVDVVGGPPATEAAVQAEHRLNLNLARQIGENGYENRSPVFSYEQSPNVYIFLFGDILIT